MFAYSVGVRACWGGVDALVPVRRAVICAQVNCKQLAAAVLAMCACTHTRDRHSGSQQRVGAISVCCRVVALACACC
eukprot:4755874-Alexandrium_andersonii.AAC.1